jgi:DNA invertase Pin-like site-specific DNA recombinase
MQSGVQGRWSIGSDDEAPCFAPVFEETRTRRHPYVWKLDWMGRSFRDLITMLDSLRDRGVKFRSLTEAIDTDTPTGRAMWQMIGVLAELERSLISERTRAGVKVAQRRGVKFGRKPKLTSKQIDHARKLIDGGQRREDVAAILNVDRTTLNRAIVAA